MASTPGEVTEAGLRSNVSVGLQYLETWLRGTGAAGINNLMEDAATAEISRSQVWQWLHNSIRLPDGQVITAELVNRMIDEELAAIRSSRGEDAFARVAGTRPGRCSPRPRSPTSTSISSPCRPTNECREPAKKMPADGEDSQRWPPAPARDGARRRPDRPPGPARYECDGLAVYTLGPALVALRAVELAGGGRRGGATGAHVLVTAELLDASIRGRPTRGTREGGSHSSRRLTVAESRAETTGGGNIATEIPSQNLAPVEYTDLPEPLPMKRVLGPSVLLLAGAIGSGEYVLWPYITSQVGLLVWLVLVGVGTQYFLNMEIERYTLATGETAVTGFTRLWKPWGALFIVMTIVPWAWPGWATGGTTTLSFAMGFTEDAVPTSRSACCC